MTRISNYEELIIERNRLQQHLILQKAKIRSDLNSIRESLEPIHSIISFLGLFKKGSSKSPLLLMGAKAGVELLVHQTLISKAGWITKLVVPFLLKGISSNVIDKIKNRVSQGSNNR